jgi:hypothetical protein
MMPKSQNFAARVASQRCLVLGNGSLKHISTATYNDTTVAELFEAVFSIFCTSKLYKEIQPVTEVKEIEANNLRSNL